MLKITMKRYHKIRWLSTRQVVSTLCDSLEFILCLFCDVKEKKDVGQEKLIFAKLKQFKYIYILYFLADILHSWALLSKVFQNKFVDVTIVGSIVRTYIVQIRMLFIVELTNLNASMFNEHSGYHIIPKYL